MLPIPPYNPSYETSNVVEYKSHGIIDVPERFLDFPSFEKQLARPIRALHPRMRPMSPDYNVNPRMVRCDPGLGVGLGVNRPDVTKLQAPKDIIKTAPALKIGQHPQTPMRYPNNFLTRLYQDDGKPPRYEYGYVPKSRQEMIDILSHHRSFSTTTRDMTEEGKLPLEPRPQPTSTLELECDRAADRWKRYYPRTEQWQLCGEKTTMKPEFQTIRDLMETDELPYAFEKPILNYGGHVPRLCVNTTLEPRRQQPEKYLSVTRQNFFSLPSCEYQQPKFPLDGRFSRSNSLQDPFCHIKLSRTEPVEPPSNFYKYF